MARTLRKSATDKSIQGVCGGLAEQLGLSSFAVRLIFIFIPLPVNVIIYMILANAMASPPRTL
ncbi:MULTISPECIES: PspC domain-containing protein [unclassified Exiguobacterium]|uniref:PspC domain-containing protein n=1 Tax=unclassified Exiguobacterium TaxID=2644629 RepID=UPI000B5908B3|nr:MULTISPECIES: PspC domain-containing protein [unclassified Exiguobacterium]ASI35413.1 PspC domain-containing protein [Exiguobacterium sp. N4-1P]ASI37426.1 PspC domain-containing protein [Exiguobacterium sp. N4-1P]